jgi:hypothetical protein
MQHDLLSSTSRASPPELVALLGKDAGGLSASTIVRL